jgi:PilZ domain
MSHLEALVQSVRAAKVLEMDQRASVRHACSLNAMSHPIDALETISWGATVHDISTHGIGIALCYPFRAGTYLAVDLPTTDGMVRTVLVRVVHARDRFDGTWHLGCEFVKPITESDLQMLI